MGTCFVIQPFDKGPFDKRYKEVIKPAIEAAGLEPYRVDEDPAVNIPIEDIERGIREAEVCIAEITTDNPNVWFELGFAIASQKEVVLICSAKRQEKFPFDIQHRKVILFKQDSTQDFEDLQNNITERIRAILKKDRKLQVSSSIGDTKGLAQHELVALVAIAENIEGLNDSVPAYEVRQDMRRSGFTKVASFLGLQSLVEKDFVVAVEETDNNGQTYYSYTMKEQGVNWLQANQELLELEGEPEVIPAYSGYGAGSDDDIPF